MNSKNFSRTAALALLLCSLASAQIPQCAPAGSPQLRFVAQLIVSGCPLFVHDTGASDGPHLAVEPVMCVTDSLQSLQPRYDPITQQMYVSIPVVLTDKRMLEEVRFRLRNLLPKSVSFVTVSDIKVSTDTSVKVRALDFVWSPDEPVGLFRVVCKLAGENCSTCDLPVRSLSVDILKSFLLSSRSVGPCSTRPFTQRLTVQNQSMFDASLNKSTFLPACRLQFIRSINLDNCTARVHQRVHMTGHFLIEPLLCHNISSMSSESVRYDYSRDMHYLKLNLVLQDDATLDAVRTQLADLAPRSVAFMQLWRAQSVVSSDLISARFEIGPLMVSVDWRSAQLRLYCRTQRQCSGIRSRIVSDPSILWHHAKWSITSRTVEPEGCQLESKTPAMSWSIKSQGSKARRPNCLRTDLVNDLCSGVSPSSCKFYRRLSDGREFIKIQQRETGTVSFARNWEAYENGFGDETDFWIGLSAIHSLSAGGATLRVEIKLWNGTELHAEYAGFQVGDASTKYRMTYREMLNNNSNIMHDAMAHSHGVQFSTIDSDNDQSTGRPCTDWGYAGWWFKSCMDCNPNGFFPKVETPDWNYMVWKINNQGRLSLRNVRLMLQI